MPRVEIDLDQFEMLSGLAAMRSDPKAARGGRHAKGFDGVKTSYEAHLAGLLGEFAAARVLGVDIDRTIYGHGGDGHRGDLTLLSGETVEVKTRGKRGFAFALGSLDSTEFKAKYGVLVWPAHTQKLEPCWMDVVGWISRGEFLARMRAVNFGYGPRLCVEAAYFNEFPIGGENEGDSAT